MSAAALLVVGAGIMTSGLWALVRSGTNVHPSQPALALVETGIYRWTRNPLYLALEWATLDVLSNGRTIFGCCAGNPEVGVRREFEALGLPPFEARGKVTDEYIAAFKELWTSDRPRFAGEFVKFDKITFAPKPPQKGGIPIWVGGESGPALRRTAKYGDAWYPIPNNPAFPMDSLKRLEAAIGKLRKMTQEAGRDPKSVGVTIRFPRYGDGVDAKAGDGERRLFSGKAADIVADIKAMSALGVGCIDTGFGGSTVPEILDEMKKFRDEVMAKA